RYNLYNAVFTPAHMTAEQLEDGTRQAYRWFYGRGRRWRRFVQECRRRDPRFNGAIAFGAHNYARHYRRPTLSPEPGYEASSEEIRALAQASAAPAQEALEVAFSGARRRIPVAGALETLATAERGDQGRTRWTSPNSCQRYPPARAAA
ncbi:MAG: hypothetical protein M3N68_13915, partial [Actinomycetota bacterium]|nr:hypothetical protein [Actinomycetota bacterium]